MHSTRGRANILRHLITRGTHLDVWNPASEQAAFEALDLCLECKGCKAECPSGVDMARLKIAFLERYYRTHPRRLRDYLFGYFHITARVLSALAPAANLGSSAPFVQSAMARLLGVSHRRPFPRFAARHPAPAWFRAAARPVSRSMLTRTTWNRTSSRPHTTCWTAPVMT